MTFTGCLQKHVVTLGVLSFLTARLPFSYPLDFVYNRTIQSGKLNKALEDGTVACVPWNTNLWPTMRKMRFSGQSMDKSIDTVCHQEQTASLPMISSTYNVTKSKRWDVNISIQNDGIPDLQGMVLRIGVLPSNFFLEHNTTTNAYSGYCWEILLEIAKRLNFTFSVVQPEDRQWGGLVNNTWNGLMGMLVRKEVDLVPVPLTETAERLTVADYACPIYEIDLKLWMLDPRLRQEKWLIIFDMLGFTVSGLLVLTFIVVVLVYILCTTPASQTVGKYYYSRLYDEVFFFGGTLLKQGSSVLPATVTGRTLLSFWWWFSIIFSVMYSGTIIASLADTRTIRPFTTIEEMLEQDVYKWGYAGNTSVQSHIQGSKLKKFRRLQKSVENFAETDPSVLSSDLSVHENKMIREKYVYIGPNAFSQLSPAANFISLRGVISSRRECMGLPHNSPLTEHVRKIVLDLDSYGILKYLWKKTNPVQRKPPVERKYIATVTFEQVKTVFYTALIGISVSGAFLIVEILTLKLSRKYKERRQSSEMYYFR